MIRELDLFFSPQTIDTHTPKWIDRNRLLAEIYWRTDTRNTYISHSLTHVL